MSKVVVLLSGGMDSTTLLYHHVNAKDEVRAIAFNYGQRHGVELIYARETAEKLGVPYVRVGLSSLAEVLPGSSQTDPGIPVPEGKYDQDNMKATVVPNRNMIMLSIAIGHAIAHGFENVSYAAHAGDHTVYPDCRPAFADAMARAAAVCDWSHIGLMKPFIEKSKADIAIIGKALGVDWEKTWSCYKGEGVHCGRCGTCIERREAFHLASIVDPTSYGPSSPSVEELVKNDWHLPQ